LVEVPLLSSFTAAATTGSFQSGDVTATAIAISVAHYRKTMHFACPERNKGLSPGAHLVDAAISILELELQAVATGKIVNGTHGAADITSTAANFDTADLETLAAASTGSPRAALIAPAAMAGIAQDLKWDGSKWIYPGLNNGVFEATLSAGDADVAIAAGPQAFAYIAEKPLSVERTPTGEAKVTEILLPRLQIPCWKVEWFDLASRQHWISLDLLFGVAAAEVAALSYVKSS